MRSGKKISQRLQNKPLTVNGLFQYKRRKALNKNSLMIMKSLTVNLLNVFFHINSVYGTISWIELNHIYPFLRTEIFKSTIINQFWGEPRFFHRWTNSINFFKIQGIPQFFSQNIRMWTQKMCFKTSKHHAILSRKKHRNSPLKKITSVFVFNYTFFSKASNPFR